MNKNSVIGIDLAKSSFQAHIASATGKVEGRKKLTRSEFLEFLAKSPQSKVFMEACPSANYWGRKAQSFGHEVKLIAPQYVKPFVKGNKNDAADAEAICEAGCRENMRFVPVKTIEQQDVQNVLRIRERHVTNRTALYNQVRSMLLEYGVSAPQGLAKLREVLQQVLRKEPTKICDISDRMLFEFKELDQEIRQLDEKVKEYDKKIEVESKRDERCDRIMDIPGIGPITAASIIAAVGNCNVFESSRQLSAWIGLVPKQHSTGGKTRLLGLSKRGNSYLRQLLIHGGRAVLMNLGEKTDPMSCWARKLKEKVGMNKAAVAIANKNARIIWAMLKRSTEYEINYKPKKGFTSGD